MAALSGNRAKWLMWLTAALYLLAALPTARGTVPEFVEHPGTVIARPGSSVSFVCRAKPFGAVLSWISDGTILINGTELAFGKVVIEVSSDVLAGLGLSVLRVQEVADGLNVSFRCLASIPGRPGIIASKAAVLVKAKLRPFRKGEDTVVSAPSGNTVSIRCSVPQSTPPATFVFEKNGTTIDESNGRYHLLPNGELQIAQVQSGDSGLYRCVAVNDITMQKVEASNVIRLQVYDPVAGERPVPVRYTPRLTVVEGGQILLPCLATGSPPPVITWEKFGGDSLPGSHSQLWLGNLRILKAEETDAGTYLCRAENEHAKANPVTTVTMLDVVLIPRIIRTPTDQVAEEGASAAFRCTLRRGVDQSTSIVWLHDGHPVVGGSGILIENGTDGGNVSSTLTIGSAQVRHQGVYQCLASNGAGEETAHALLRVHEAPAWRKQAPWPTDEVQGGSVASNGRPAAAAKTGPQPTAEDGTAMALLPPSVMQLSSSEAIVRWSASDQLKKASRSFRLEMKNQSADWLAIFSELPTNTADVVVNRLGPGSVYRFRIAADLVAGQVIRSPASSGFRLQLNKGGSTTTTAAIQPFAFTAGERGSGINELSSPLTSHLKQSRVSVAPTKPPAEAGIIMPPPKPTIKQIGDTSVLVQWTQSYQGMPITFYRIQYKDTESGRGRGRGAQWVTADHDVKPPTTQYELSGLRPGGSYKFRLAAVYVNRDNRVSEATDRVLLVGSGGRAEAGGSRRRLPPQVVPRLTQLLSQAADQMFLKWEYHTDSAPIDGFVVQYMPVESLPRVWHENRVAGFNSREWELRGLQPNTSYQVCVRSENAAGRSPCSNTLMRTTKAESTASSYDDVLDVLNQPNRGPSPVHIPNLSPSGGNSDGRSNDENYQPETRGRTSQQPDELLYMVVGVVAGAMLLTLVVFIVACVRRQVLHKRCLANSAPPTEVKGNCGAGPAACQRTFNDASRLIFNDILQQKGKQTSERQWSVVPGLQSTSCDVAQCDGQRELLENDLYHNRSSTIPKCNFAPEASPKYPCSLSDSLKDIQQSKELHCCRDDGRRPGSVSAGGSVSATSSLSRRLSSYGCTEGDVPEACPLASESAAAESCNSRRCSVTCDSGENEEEHDNDSDDGVVSSAGVNRPSESMPRTAVHRQRSPAAAELAADAQSNFREGRSCSEPGTMPQHGRPLGFELSIGSPPAAADPCILSSDDPLWQQLDGAAANHCEADVRHCRKYDATGYHDDRPLFSKQDSAESRPFG